MFLCVFHFFIILFLSFFLSVFPSIYLSAFIFASLVPVSQLLKCRNHTDECEAAKVKLKNWPISTPLGRRLAKKLRKQDREKKIKTKKEREKYRTASQTVCPPNPPPAGRPVIAAVAASVVVSGSRVRRCLPPLLKGKLEAGRLLPLDCFWESRMERACKQVSKRPTDRPAIRCLFTRMCCALLNCGAVARHRSIALINSFSVQPAGRTRHRPRTGARAPIAGQHTYSNRWIRRRTLGHYLITV